MVLERWWIQFLKQIKRIHLAKQKVSSALLYVGCLGISVSGLFLLFYKVVDVEVTGIIAMVFNVLMFAAPGEKMFRVCKTKQYDLIPIFSTIGGFFCSLCWLMYGVYKGDLKLIIPNGLGLFFSILQIIVYLVFYCKKRKKKTLASRMMIISCNNKK